MTHVALYIRVSTEEQALHGYSIVAQQQALREYCHKNGYIIVDEYIDEGISARKKYYRRHEFVRLLDGVKNHDFDLILFTKLDRWFRNISDYYKIQEILEENKVNWKTIFENYDTSTSSGRLLVNIMLSVAQDEADRTSERIKAVFRSKISRGEAITGPQPFGYKVEGKKVVIEPESAERVKDIFNHFISHRSIHATYRYYKNKYNENCSYSKVSDVINKRCYTGFYNEENPSYYPRIISDEQFAAAQAFVKQSFVRSNETKRIYIFSGLIECEECSHTMHGCLMRTTKQDYYAYRCRNAVAYHGCSHRRIIREDVLEQYLLNNIGYYIYTQIAEADMTEYSKNQINKKFEIEKIKKKLQKIKDLYVGEFITFGEYKKDYDTYTAQLAEFESKVDEPSINKGRLKQLLESDYRSLYAQLDAIHKRQFWQEIIKKVLLSSNNEVRHVYFN